MEEIIYEIEMKFDAYRYEWRYEAAQWLGEQEEVKDIELKNGICLCRKCHQKTHLENKIWPGPHLKIKIDYE